MLLLKKTRGDNGVVGFNGIIIMESCYLLGDVNIYNHKIIKSFFGGVSMFMTLSTPSNEKVTSLDMFLVDVSVQL